MSPPVPVPVGVLASGGGSNLQALLDAEADAAWPARIEVVISNRADAGALVRARRHGRVAVHLPRRKDRPREEHDQAVVAALREHGVQWVCLAGYMLLVTPVLLQAFPDRVLNIHPALLPAFPGLHGQAQALHHGVRIAGATVHLVDGGCDTGPVICQGAVPVLPGDDEATLSARILRVEHRLYPMALRWAAQGRLRVEGRQVAVDLPPGEATSLWDPAA